MFAITDYAATHVIKKEGAEVLLDAFEAKFEEEY
jgi:hypothetical protein